MIGGSDSSHWMSKDPVKRKYSLKHNISYYIILSYGDSSEASLGSNYFQWNISQERDMIKSVEVVLFPWETYYG